MNPYLWNGRILKEKYVDRYLSRIVHEQRNNVIKYTLVIATGLGLLFVLGFLNANKQPEKPIKSEKVTTVTQQSTNPVTTAVYNKELQNKK